MKILSKKRYCIHFENLRMKCTNQTSFTLFLFKNINNHPILFHIFIYSHFQFDYDYLVTHNLL